MLWSPYIGPENVVKAAIVIHRTNIFDYAVIQPHYYAGGGAETLCEGLRTGIAIQRVTYSNGHPVLHESAITCTKTVIGCQMEINWEYAINTDYQQRYNKSQEVFNQSAGAYDKYNTNFGFYFGCPSLTDSAVENSGYDTVKAIVNNFFK